MGEDVSFLLIDRWVGGWMDERMRWSKASGVLCCDFWGIAAVIGNVGNHYFTASL